MMPPRPVSASGLEKGFLTPESLYRDMTGGVGGGGQTLGQDRKLELQSTTSNVSMEYISKEEKQHKFQVLILSTLFQFFKQ